MTNFQMTIDETTDGSLEFLENVKNISTSCERVKPGEYNVTAPTIDIFKLVEANIDTVVSIYPVI